MTKPMILIADNDPDSADVLGLIVGMRFPESEVVVGYGGQEALDIASRQRPDVALLDMEMPEVSGEALARALRAMYPDKAPLLIALSGNTALLELVSSNGIFDQFLSKPIEVSTLMRFVGKRLAVTESGPWNAP
jgi:CheY-like chemotaxis protein